LPLFGAEAEVQRQIVLTAASRAGLDLARKRRAFSFHEDCLHCRQLRPRSSPADISAVCGFIACRPVAALVAWRAGQLRKQENRVRWDSSDGALGRWCAYDSRSGLHEHALCGGSLIATRISNDPEEIDPEIE